MKILVFNSGSSSQKSSLYDFGNVLPQSAPPPIWDAKIEWHGDQAEAQVTKSGGVTHKAPVQVLSRGQATEYLLDSLCDGKVGAVSALSEIDVVGHRVVHGGRDYEEPTIVTAEVKSAIVRLAAFAPLHNAAELESIDIVEKRLGAVLQVAVFDTGFHSKIPQAAAVYPGPFAWLDKGIRRYGFHGINHQYCAQRAAQLLSKDLPSLKLVTCHLGNGCSLAAIQNGRSVDTTMGFTPLEGLMMGTRSGSVDPGILTYLMRQGNITASQLDDVLNSQSGLLGISGISGDMRSIVAAMKEGHARAKLAFDIFVHRLRSGIGQMIAALGGVDALIFTAGIGENSPEVRAAACESFRFLDAKLDPAKNAQSPSDGDISLPGSAVRLLVIHAQEDWAIACACWSLASAKSNARAGTS